MSRLIAMWICVGLMAGGARTGDRADRQSCRPKRAPKCCAACARKKPKAATPYQPNALERGMRLAEERATRLLAAPDGLHPKLGSLTTGSGFAFGAGYRNRRLFDRRRSAFGMGGRRRSRSTGRSKDGSTCPILPSGRLTIGTYARRHRLPAGRFLRCRPGRPSRRSHELSAHEHARRCARRGEAGADGHRRRRRSNIRGPKSDAGGTSAADDRRRGSTIRRRRACSGARTFVRTSAFLDVDYRQPKNARRGGCTGSTPAASMSDPTRSRSSASTSTCASTRASSQSAGCSPFACSCRRPNRTRVRACRST